jgi:magnesium transporter
MRRYLAPQRDVFRTMLDHSDAFFDENTRLFFRDVYDHNLRVYDMLDTLRDQVSNATDLYLSVVNNNMNQVMKRLTVITTIFMPITFITGVFGMNFGHSPQVETDPGWYFWACIVLIAFVASLMYLALKRMRLI